MKPNITELIVEQDKCIGCGACDTICPVDVLKMDFNQQGNYEPFESEGCLDKCTLCVDVCPFIEENLSETELAHQLYASEENVQHYKELGYFINTYEIHKKHDDERLESASGGAGNWFQKLLLKLNIVDKVISVEPNGDPEKLFKFAVYENENDVDRSRGSAYYPVEMSEVLDYVMNNDGRYAIVVLPCFANAIRLAQQKNRKLRQRIKILIGLVCGQQKSKKFTEELAKIALKEEKLAKVQYRYKQVHKPASDYAFNFTGVNGTNVKLSWSAEPSKFWANRLFTPNACNHCEDVFAVCADVVLMDAWLPEYTKDYRGHSLVITRNNAVDKVIQNDNTVDISVFDVQKVYQSQKRVVETKLNYKYGNSNFFTNQLLKYRKTIQQLSNKDYVKNKIKIEKQFQKIRNNERMKTVAYLPNKILKKLMKTTRRNK